MSSSTGRQGLSTRAYYAFAATCLLLTAVILAFFPIADDDWCYIGQLKPDDNEQPYAALIQFWKVFKYRYATDNARLANIFGFCTVQFPFFLIASCKIIFMTLFCHMMCVAAGVRKGMFTKLVFLTTLLIFGICWEQAHLSYMFFCNYILSSCILLFALKKYLAKSRAVVSPFLIGILAGACHESFGLAFFGGAIVCAAFHREYVTKGNIALVIGALLGLIWLYMAPGWSVYHAPTKYNLRSLIYLLKMPLASIYPLIWTALLINKKTRHLALKPFPLFTMGSAPSIIVACVGNLARAAFPCSVLSIVSYTIFISEALTAAVLKKTITKVVTAVVAIVCIAHLSLITKYTIEERHQIDAIEKMFINARAEGRKHAYAFLDLNLSWEKPFFALRRPDYNLFTCYYWGLYNCSLYYGFEHFGWVPTKLRDYSEGTGHPIPSLPGFLLVDNAIVGPPDIRPCQKWAEIEYANKFKDATFVNIVPFVTQSGNRHSFVFLPLSYIGNALGEISDIKITDFPNSDDYFPTQEYECR